MQQDEELINLIILRLQVDEVQAHTNLMMTLSLLAGSFPQGPLIWKQLSFPEDKKDQLTEIHTDI